jgi:hypothetical protein
LNIGDKWLDYLYCSIDIIFLFFCFYYLLTIKLTKSSNYFPTIVFLFELFSFLCRGKVNISRLNTPIPKFPLPISMSQPSWIKWFLLIVSCSYSKLPIRYTEYNMKQPAPAISWIIRLLVQYRLRDWRTWKSEQQRLLERTRSWWKGLWIWEKHFQRRCVWAYCPIISSLRTTSSFKRKSLTKVPIFILNWSWKRIFKCSWPNRLRSQH